jgi:hypothetical protein
VRPARRARSENQISSLATSERVSASGVSHTTLQPALAEFCEQEGVPFLDAFSVLRRRAEMNNRKEVFIPLDEHLDVEGHDALAQAIVAWLRGRSIASSSPNEPSR